jgi:ABC-type multidrug transport system ATPase subunit
MSEEILKALTQLFAIITKQDGGVSENERNYVIRFFQQELDQDSVREYTDLYDQQSGYGEQSDKDKLTSVKDSVRTLGICRKINKTLTQKQKVIVLMKILEMVGSDRNFTAQRMEIVNTVSTVFKIEEGEYKLLESFATTEALAGVDHEDVLVASRAERMPLQQHIHAHIDGHLLFVNVRSVSLVFSRYIGSENNLLNGFVMQPGRIYLYSHGSTIKTPAGDALYYGDVTSHFNREISTTKLSFNASIEEFRFATGDIGLRDVVVSEGPGKLIGIMGASGAGKTTLLNVLAGLERPTRGSIRINGIDIHKEKDKVRGVIGYVAQDDLLIEELTVYENLYYNARLCFGNATIEELDARVMKVLAGLGLDQRKDLRVGNVLDKTISGGQRKRLNIALELIREPAVLFLDEPTSGLSSRDSETVIDLLKELSLKGKLVFVVIHQPSSDIYKMFDKMIIMDTGGYPAYYGLPVEAIKYFKKATHQADSNRGQCETCSTVNPEQIFSIIEARVVDEYGQPTAKRKITPSQWFEMFRDKFRINKVEDETGLPPGSLDIPGRLKQMVTFMKRDLRAKISNRQYVAINLLQGPLLGLVLAFIIRYKSSSNGLHYLFRFNDNIPAFLLMAVIVALFMGLTVSAEEIIRDRKILRRESFLNLSWNSYIASKAAILFMISAIQMILFVVVSHWILEIRGMTFAFWLVLFSTACFANLLGLNISALFKSAVTVYILIPLLLIPQMILSGLLFPFDKLNSLISERGQVPLVADMMVSRWAFESMAVHQFVNNEYGESFYRFNRDQSQANIRSTFICEELRNRNAFIQRNLSSTDDSVKQLVRAAAAVLRNTLRNERFEGASELYTALGSEPLTPGLTNRVDHWLDVYKQHYLKVYGDSERAIDKLVSFYEKNGWSVNENKDLYANESLSDLVRNVRAGDPVLELNDEILQQLDPVYQAPTPSGPFDYRSGFYFPEKNFFGMIVPTYAFNLLVIWLMCVVMYLVLAGKIVEHSKGLVKKVKKVQD